LGGSDGRLEFHGIKKNFADFFPKRQYALYFTNHSARLLGTNHVILVHCTSGSVVCDSPAANQKERVKYKLQSLSEVHV